MTMIEVLRCEVCGYQQAPWHAQAFCPYCGEARWQQAEIEPHQVRDHDDVEVPR